MANIKLNIENYGEQEYPSGITTAELVKKLKPEGKIFLGKINNRRISLQEPITEDGDFKFRLDPFCNCAWEEANKIAAQFLFHFLKEQGIVKDLIESEVTDSGFSIQVLVDKNISEKQLPLFGGKVLKLFAKNMEQDVSPLEAKEIKFLKLRGVSGAESDKGIVNRIFGFATLSKDVYDQRINEIEEAESRDHRKIGKDLEIFMIDELVGKGLPIWLPNGVALKRQISNFIYEQEDKYGSLQVETPVLGSIDFYKTSGHYQHYKDGMFPDMTIEEDEAFILRPMACPHHVAIYKSKPRSYRELPIRYAELVKQYRYEPSGSLLGLERVRAMELTDSHIFLKTDQVKDELKKSYNLIKSTLDKFEINIDYIELALHDPAKLDKYHGDAKVWKEAETQLKEFMDEEEIEYRTMKGEAAFYGPKIDIQIKTALGHIITVSTIQLDFLLPERFDLSYIDSNKEKIKPIMIHRGHIGTMERFISVLLEQTKGNLPMWLAPQQAVIIPVNNEAHIEYANKVYMHMKKLGIRVTLDDSEERLSYKIREHQTKKVKTQIIIGDKEMNNGTISLRYYGEENTQTLKLDNLGKIYEN